MIQILLLSGPFSGEVREMPEDVQPMDFFRMLVQKNWDWRTDYSRATDEETHQWFRAELAARIVWTLKRKLPVSFMGRLWQFRDVEDFIVIAQDLEDAIVNSGRIVTIDSDDERGLVIGVRGFEK